MDELEKKSQKGLDQFKEEGNIHEVKSSMDSMIDNMFDDVDDGHNNSDGLKKNGFLKWIAAIVALVALVGIGYLGFRDGSSDKASKKTIATKVLFAQYFEPLDDVTNTTLRGAEDDQVTLSQGMKSYNAGDYKTAATLLSGQSSKESQLYAAISMLAGDQSQLAKEKLSSMKSNPDYKDYHDIISWYYALSLLEIEDRDIARAELQAIVKAGGYMSKEAAGLLGQI